MPWPPTTHQHVEDEIDAGQGWAATLSERHGLGEQATPTSFLWIVGKFYGGALTAPATGTTSMTANRLYLAPIYLPLSRSVDQVAVNVATAGTAGHVARLGIYNASATTGLPTTVKVDAGTVAVDSTGIKTLTISQTLHGLYWLAITSQSGQMTATATAGCAVIGGADSASSNPNSALIRASTVPTSALPDLTGDATVTATALTTVPRLLLRAA